MAHDVTPLPAPEAPEVNTSLVAHSARSTAVAQVVNQSVRFLTSIVLARLLSPQDFGVVALAMVLSLFLDEIKDIGMGAAIVQRRTVDQVLLSSVFFANLFFGVLASALLFLLAGPLCSALGSPEATPAAQGFAGIMLVTAAGQIHLSLLRRSMSFRAIATVTSVMAVVTMVVAIATALAGLEFWALVLGNAAGAVASTVMLWYYDPWRPSLQVSLTALASIWRTSWHIFMVGFLTLVWVQVDKVIVSRFAGGAALGVYTMGQRVVTTPLSAISGVVTDITYSAFARRQDDNAALRAGFTRGSAVIALVTFPMMFGVAAVAAPLVLVVFGPAWSGLIPVIWFLAPAGAFTSVTFNTDQILRAKQRSDWSWRWGVVHLVVLAGIALFMVRWGVVGVAAGYAFGTLVLMPFTLMLAFRTIDARSIDYARALFPYFWMATLMAAVVTAEVQLLSGLAAPNVVQLLAGIVTGGAVYAGLLALRRPPAVQDLFFALRDRRPR